MQQNPNDITHGLCQKCRIHLLAQVGIKLNAFLDELDTPVILVDSDVTVKMANKQARSIIQKNITQIEGFRGGDVFECKYATLPGGCGQTVHCSGCAIRNAVTETYNTGKSLLHTPAYLKKDSPEDELEVRFLISTEKLGDFVLLRIDSIGDQIL